MTPSQKTGLFLGLTLPFGLFLLPGIDLHAQIALSIAAFAIVFWTFEPVPIPYTAIVMLTLYPLLNVLPFEDTFHAFSGKAIWLVFSGMALSLGITETPLGLRLSHLILDRVRSYQQLLFGLHLLGLLMAILIPSGVVRVLILMPMVLGLLKSLGEKPGSRISAAFVLGTVCATYFGGVGILTASVPNLVLLGVLESHGIALFWGQWAYYLFPVMGFLRVGAIYLLVRFLFRPALEPRLSKSPDFGTPPPHLTPAEKKVLWILLAGVLLWATDVVHGTHPVFIGLGIVLFIYLPVWGPLPFDTIKKVNFPLLLYIAATFTMGAALDHTGLNAHLTAFFTPMLQKVSSPIVLMGCITWLALPFDFLMDTAVVAGVLTPLVLDLAEALHLPALPLALSLGIGTGLVSIPYQGAPFVVAYSFGQVQMGQFIRLMVLISLVTLTLLLPLNLLYWRLIGFI
ncbi:MAG: SLC13 family permease [bacterium]|jgi:anion transporter|nr:SLC13 family permease [bacterium]